ncbi:hypothetical protein EXIGLDRAFT_767815 [Exidia glandulosa HHB12029]|uniref:Uncharacterized protein n=1 Tax=Exidia glandulosa HHB12029 TaxID=1314781 RepID=A0A165IQ26_EXIGL|nr:hypothetical protein EXIGLDRAFT_767815 [Exidia glandulosa HHB12029]
MDLRIAAAGALCVLYTIILVVHHLPLSHNTGAKAAPCCSSGSAVIGRWYWTPVTSCGDGGSDHPYWLATVSKDQSASHGHNPPPMDTFVLNICRNSVGEGDHEQR